MHIPYCISYIVLVISIVDNCINWNELNNCKTWKLCFCLFYVFSCWSQVLLSESFCIFIIYNTDDAYRLMIKYKKCSIAVFRILFEICRALTIVFLCIRNFHKQELFDESYNNCSFDAYDIIFYNFSLLV